VRQGCIGGTDTNCVVVDSNFLRFAFGMPFATAVLEISHQLLLLHVYRDHRLPALLEPRRLRVDELELGIAIGVLIAFPRLTVGLQAVAGFVEQPRHRAIASSMALTGQLVLLVRKGSPLPRKDEESLAALLSGARVPGKVVINQAAWLENGREITFDLHDRAAPSSKTRNSDDPVLAIRRLLQEKVPPLCDHYQAIVFPNQGGKGSCSCEIQTMAG
jgi:hypothetical protein